MSMLKWNWFVQRRFGLIWQTRLRQRMPCIWLIKEMVRVPFAACSNAGGHWGRQGEVLAIIFNKLLPAQLPGVTSHGCLKLFHDLHTWRPATIPEWNGLPTFVLHPWSTWWIHFWQRERCFRRSMPDSPLNLNRCDPRYRCWPCSQRGVKSEAPYWAWFCDAVSYGQQANRLAYSMISWLD